MAATTFQTIVIGGGPAGLATALALADAGIDTAVVVPCPPPAPAIPTQADPGLDTRTAALFSGSVSLLDNLGVWEALAPSVARIRAIRITDATGRSPRAPEVLFEAREIGLEAFGYNVPQCALQLGLGRAVLDRPGLDVFASAGVMDIETGGPLARVRLKEGIVLCTPLVVGADGRGSITRAAAGIGTGSHAYPQTAIVCSFQHARPHGGISTEFHRAAGPLTTVPLPGNASSLVWVEHPATAERLAAADENTFRCELERYLGGLLGRVGRIGTRGHYPLALMTAERFVGPRVALVGEAAHVMPPIGAQGLNLGLRDGAALADVLREAKARGLDPGCMSVLAGYQSGRQSDSGPRMRAVDLLNRSLLSPALPIHLGRGFGLALLKSIGPLRRAAMREGLQPTGDLPSLMRRRPAGGADGKLTA